MSSSIVSLFGNELLSSKDKVQTSEALKGKITLVYFSAHWCPPCRGFTPVLTKWYENVVKSGNRSDIELVFVSSDQDETAFDGYYGSMPWLALPYSERSRKDDISKLFGVSGIPMLIVLDEDGSVLSKDGRALVSADPNGSNITWKGGEGGGDSIAEKATASPFIKIFGEELAGKNGVVKTSEATKDKVVLVYFSAHWCPPCRGFTPVLCEWYKSITASRNDVEVIFVSSDQDEKAFDGYYGTMPFLALPYSARSTQSKISNDYAIQGIPSLLVFGADGSLLSRDGRSLVSGDPKGKSFEFTASSKGSLSAAASKGGGGSSCVIL